MLPHHRAAKSVFLTHWLLSEMKKMSKCRNDYQDITVSSLPPKCGRALAVRWCAVVSMKCKVGRLSPCGSNVGDQGGQCGPRVGVLGA